MAILNRPGKPHTAADTLPAEEHFAFAAEIPVGGDQPLWKMQMQVHAEPQADGEQLRLRLHLQTNFASALRPALAHGVVMPRALRLAERAGHAAQAIAQRALRLPLLRRLAEPLLELDFNTWVEIRASTASLDAGSHGLLPQGERLQALGIQPHRAGDMPLAESWVTEAADSFAQVSVLQIDKRHLPARLARLLGDRPFGLAATIVNTAQEKK